MKCDVGGLPDHVITLSLRLLLDSEVSLCDNLGAGNRWLNPDVPIVPFMFPLMFRFPYSVHYFSIFEQMYFYTEYISAELSSQNVLLTIRII